MNIPILMYHHLVAGDQADERFYEISIRLFQRHLDWLEQWNFKTVTFQKLLAALQGGQRLPDRAVIITFDDGFASFLELAVPALRSRGMDATIFVPAGYIGATNRWDEASGFPARAIMTEEELREIAIDGMEIGSHGWLHRNLTLATADEVEEELVRSKDALEQITEQSIDVFAYPYGAHRASNFEQLRRAGYQAAASIFSNERSVTANPYAIRRVYMHSRDDAIRFRAKVSKIYLKYRAWRDCKNPGD